MRSGLRTKKKVSGLGIWSQVVTLKCIDFRVVRRCRRTPIATEKLAWIERVSFTALRRQRNRRFAVTPTSFEIPMKCLPILWPVMLIGIVLSCMFLDKPLYFTLNNIHLHEHVVSVKQAAIPVLQRAVPIHPRVNRVWIQDYFDWPPILSALSPFVLLFAIFVRPGKWRDLLIFTCVSILLTFVLKNELKVLFSREWPISWVTGDPALIKIRDCHFHFLQGKFLQGNESSGSFPSGHTAIAFAALLPIGLLFRKTLPLCIAVASLEGVIMVILNYHFLSDVLAGALIGITCVLVVRSLLGIPPHAPLPIDP
jgi:membrane-associated phospholipid phosphatase